MVTDETKAMALDNICHHLNSFLKCSAFENIVFCWVVHQQEIIDSILERIDTENWRVVCVSLVCDAETLEKRLQGDVDRGIRRQDVIRSLARLALYGLLKTIKADTSGRSIDDVAREIMGL